MSNITNRSAAGWGVWLILFVIVYSIMQWFKSKSKPKQEPILESFPQTGPGMTEEEYTASMRAIYEKFIRSSK